MTDTTSSMKVYDVYMPDPYGQGVCVLSTEDKQEALDYRAEHPEAIIVPTYYTKEELAQMEADSLPGVQGYCPY